MPFPRISIDPAQMGGVPCIRNLRIPVAMVVRLVAQGLDVDAILAEYPDLQADDVAEALRFAASAVDERTLPLTGTWISDRQRVVSPRGRGLRAAGHDAVHLRDRGLHAARDEVVFELAADEDRIIVSADTDFGTLLALRDAQYPSVILFRRLHDGTAAAVLRLLLSQLDRVDDDLRAGAAVVIERDRLRVRRLPFGRD